MIFTKTFKFRLRPNRTQTGLCAQFAGAARWIFNRGLAQRNQLWEGEKRSISYYDQNNELVFLKAEETTSWLKDIHSQVLQQALLDLKAAFDHFFRRVKNKEIPGYPQFRRKGENDSFRYPQGVRVEKGYSRFSPKFYMWTAPKLPGLSDHKQVNIRNMDLFMIAQSRGFRVGPNVKFWAESTICLVSQDWLGEIS